MKVLKQLIAVVALLASTTGMAATISVEDRHDPFLPVYILTGLPYTYTHDLTSYGLPGPEITSASLVIGLLDLTDKLPGGPFRETVTVNVNGIDNRTITNVSFGGAEYDVDILTALRETGLLEVTLSVQGSCVPFLGCILPRDVVFDYSVLSADITTADVPEPATLLTLGAGLLGLGAARRRRRA